MSYKTLLNKSTKSIVQLDNMVNQLRAQIDRDPSIRNGSGYLSNAYGVAFESLQADVQGQLSTALEGFSAALSQLSVGNEEGNLRTAAQHEAGVIGGMIGMNPQAFLQYKPSLEGMDAIAYEGDDSVQSRLVTEAYDEKPTASTIVYNIAYNAQAARQDDFGEAFFPTVVVPPDQNGFNISVKIMSVMSDVRRQTSGAIDAFNKRNILGAAIDPTILTNDSTTIVPVYRDESANNFVDPSLVAPATQIVDGDSVTTAPLAVGKSFSLLAISQTDAVLETGLLDATDSIDSAIKLKNVYIKLTGTVNNQAVTEVIKFPTTDLDTATFTPVQQGQYRGMQLTFDNSSLMINADTVTASGGASQLLSAIISAGAVLRLNVQMFGKVNLELGNTSLNASTPLVQQIQDSSGNVLDPTTGTGLAYANVFATAQVIGYDLSARRTNLNKRQRGQLVDISYNNSVYTVPLLAPITAVRPLTQAENNDTSDLATLVTLTRIRTSNSAVKKLLDTATLLKSVVNSNDQISNLPATVGAGRFLLAKAFYEESTFDVGAKIDSLTSSGRADDARNLIVNKLRDIVYRAGRDTAYQVGADAVAGGRTTPPVVIIGTDPVIAQWLITTGDFRTLSTLYEVKLVTTYNQTMKGKIAISFGRFDGSSDGVANPLHFGNMAYKPEIVTVLPLHRNGSNNRELTVAPSYLHVVNLPILAIINIVNLDASVLASKVTVNINQTP